MIRFGPSGNSPSFFEDGNKNSIEAPKWLKSQGLEAYEYSFGRGYTMSLETAKKLGAEAKKYDVLVSVHAPYYINLANPDETMKEKSFAYILKGLEYVKAMNGKHIVVHVGSQGKQTREEATELIKKRIKEFYQRFDLSAYKGINICPETMGKPMQIGDVIEIVDICTLNKNLVPTFDFGHINALTQGGLKTVDDCLAVFNFAIKKLGFNRVKNCHIHFSKIEYGAKGEIRHLDYNDKVYGPDFQPVAEAIKILKLTPTVICESKTFMAEDAKTLKNIYQNI